MNVVVKLLRGATATRWNFDTLTTGSGIRNTDRSEAEAMARRMMAIYG